MLPDQEGAAGTGPPSPVAAWRWNRGRPKGALAGLSRLFSRILAAWPPAAPEHCPALARAAAPSAPPGVGALPTPPRLNHRQHRPLAARQMGSHSRATTTSPQGHGGRVSLLKAPPVPRTDSARTPRGQPTWTPPATLRSPGGLGTSRSPTGTYIGVNYWCCAQICLLSATLFGYSNHRGIDRLGRMPWPWPLLIDHLFVKMTFNNHK